MVLRLGRKPPNHKSVEGLAPDTILLHALFTINCALVRNYSVCLYAQTWLEIQYHVQCLAVVGDLLIQPCQVEFVLNVVLIHLGKSGGWDGEGRKG